MPFLGLLAMNLFIVVLEEMTISPELEARVKSLDFVTDTHKLTDNTLLVRGYADNPRMLSLSIGISGEESPPILGVVFKLNGSYFGYHYPALWDWLAESRV